MAEARQGAAVFDGCDNSATDFDFTTPSDALAASQALLDQVFLDVLGQGAFDSSPTLTVGCPGGFDPLAGIFVRLCIATTPYGFSLSGGSPVFLMTEVASAINSFPGFGPDSANFSASFPPPDTSASPIAVFARWSPSPDAEVPEPASLTLLGLGLAGIGARRWRQRKAS